MSRIAWRSWVKRRGWPAAILALLLAIVPAALAGASSPGPTGPASGGCDYNAGQTTRNFEDPASHDPYQQYCTPNVQRQDTPNDPDYDQSEPDTQNASPPDTNFYDERFDLFGFPSALTQKTAIYHDPFDRGELTPSGYDGIDRFDKPQVSGFNAAGAWKVERGRPDVVIAILDDGIDWRRQGLRRQIHLNTGELPFPEVEPSMSPSLDPTNASLSCATMPHGPTKAADGAYVATTYDELNEGAAEVDDYACDPRVAAVIAAGYPGREQPSDNGHKLITGQDLLHTFGHCQINASTHLIVPHSGADSGAPGCPGADHFDNDGNGYDNDIVGWNFFDNDNDPTDLSSYFAAGGHGSDRAQDAVEEGNDGQGSIGVCPHCRFMPVRVWDTFVSDGNTFGMGMVYATDNGAKVLEGADGSLDHTSFAEAASTYAYEHGVVQTYSGDDLNTGDHNYPGNYSHAMLIQGTVNDSDGLGTSYPQLPAPPSGYPSQLQPVANEYNALRNSIDGVEETAAAEGFGSEIPTETYFRGANTTQYGGHSSIAMWGETGSDNTSRAAGAAGLVISAALDHGITLTPDETREILEQTAERVVAPNTVGLGAPDLAAPETCPTGVSPSATCATPDEQWTEHFGWGRVDLGDAVAVAASGKIPPIAAIDSPDWFAPLAGASFDITGLAQARFATGHALTWKLMWAPGVQPTPGSWRTASTGSSNGTVTSFGSISLSAVRSALASYLQPADPGAPAFSPTATNPYTGQFSVQLEVSGTGIPITGIDRRVFTAIDDSTLEPGFPKRMCQVDLGACTDTTPASGGEAPIRYADLTGDNQQELIVPTEDGYVRAYRPNGSELPGWPVRTDEQQAAVGHERSPALRTIGLPHEPPRAPVIADLSGDGYPDVITAAGIHVYAWRGDGKPVPGFPVQTDLSHCGPALESQALEEHPKCGFLASPAVGYLEGRRKGLDIVEPGLDGWLYAWDAHGKRLPNFPVKLQAPVKGNTQIAESINDPALGNLTEAADGHDDVVVATNEEYGPDSAPSSLYGILSAAAGGTTDVYAVDGETGKYLPGWPITIPGIIQDELPMVGPGNDPAIADIGGKEEVINSATGSALQETAPDGATTRTITQEGAGAAGYGAASNATDKSGGLNLFESASVGDLLGTGTPDVVKYELSIAGATNLLLVGQNTPYNHLIGAWDAATGAPLPAYPTITDDYQFLSASNVAKIAPGQTNQILAGTGLGLLHAYDGATGQDVSGFPKITGGWLFSPATLSNDGRMADVTREGYLFEWKVGQTPCQPTGTEWPTFRHDPRDSGNFNTDATPPASPASVTLTGLGGGRYTLRLITPGNDGFCGDADHYLAKVNGRSVSPSTIGLGKPGAGGSTASVTMKLPAGARVFLFQAVDAAGNVGAPARLRVPAAGQTTSGGGLPIGLSRSGCPRAFGHVRGTALGPLRLGMTRAQARKALPRHSTRGRRYMDFFCLAPIGIRVGYAAPRLSRSLSRGQRRHVEDRVVWISTSNRYYAVRGVRTGTRLSTVARRLHTGRGFHVGSNWWYLFADGQSRGIFKVRRGIIEEVGIANRALTRTRSADRRFLTSFY